MRGPGYTRCRGVRTGKLYTLVHLLSNSFSPHRASNAENILWKFRTVLDLLSTSVPILLHEDAPRSRNFRILLFIHHLDPGSCQYICRSFEVTYFLFFSSHLLPRMARDIFCA
ncbi:uncharacterized protein LOC143151095 [Ptiloglossa arizonensis]|uniref:uncharacterized protein LOC143151095 n=1 Tax=Ptiloglossa arizonensis TaxID=3350558 RepID=UPI003FA01A83